MHRYDREGRYVGWRSYSKLTSLDDLYTIVRTDGTRDLRTERALAQLETSFGRVRTFLAGGKRPLHRHQAEDLAWFMAAMRERSPKARDHWQNFLDRVIATGTAIENDLQGLPPGNKKRKVRALARPDGQRGESGLSLDEVRSLSGRGFGSWLPAHVRVAGRIMQDMHVMILDACAGCCFVTSDNPVVWWNPAMDQRRFGLGRKAIEITMPITPRICALLTHDGGNGRADVDQSTVDAINGRTLNQCDSEFFAESAGLTVNWFAAR